MSSAEVLRRCHERLAELEAAGLRIPDPFDAVELADRAGGCLGHRIRLCGIAMPAGAPFGLTLFTTDGGHIIAYEQSTNRLHRDHIISHELGHILLGHEPMPIDEPDAARLVFPRLSPELVNRVLNRNGTYGGREEQEAETMATILMERVSQVPDVSEVPGQSIEDAAIAARLSNLFERPL
ncbi:hypothetical protein GCM10009557_00240 [Virgisporangium ochraceum]|uniref:IrrE N-terminal-like domain-containing protein n=1 Tax=Virgisporangium ochraceum TaxID=65505 RepID=A0A8J4A2Q7_9ACTN|nr:hypothetical protein [Virgisporangium ochraceum]GIJ74056.1 hypothetical protein Voc01_089730 [Virgisporangium ochraceum]